MKNMRWELSYCGYRDQCFIVLSQGFKGDLIKEGITEMKRKRIDPCKLEVPTVDIEIMRSGL